MGRGDIGGGHGVLCRVPDGVQSGKAIPHTARKYVRKW
jgi:hypothetical protein